MVIKFGWDTGSTLTYAAYTAAGAVRTGAGTSLPEKSGTGFYYATNTDLQTGDVVIILEGSTFVGVGEYNNSAILTSDGLDSVSITAPDGVPTNFRELVVQLWRRFFGKSTLSSTELLCYRSDGTTVATTQAVEDIGILQTQGEAS